MPPNYEDNPKPQVKKKCLGKMTFTIHQQLNPIDHCPMVFLDITTSNSNDNTHHIRISGYHSWASLPRVECQADDNSRQEQFITAQGTPINLCNG